MTLNMEKKKFCYWKTDVRRMTTRIYSVNTLVPIPGKFHACRFHCRLDNIGLSR